jgi:general secretion pathway protein D
VPVLGDVPIVGDLFKTRTRERKKTNLMVFLRPVVIRDAAQNELLSLDRYELMRGKQIEAQPTPSIVTPVNNSVIMPPLQVPAPAVVPPQTPASGVPAMPAPLMR